MESSFIGALLSQPHLPSPIICLAEASLEAVAQRVCASLNATGGWIVIGIDDEHKATGVSEDYDKALQAEITRGISPLPLVYVQQEEYEGVPVVLVTVMKGSLPPYSYKGRFYTQDGDEVAVPSSDRLSQLLRESYVSRSDWERVNNLYASEEDLDDSLMDKVYNNGLSLGRLTKSEDGLRSLMSELQLLKTLEVTNGAVALFAKSTKGLLPQCRVRIQVMTQGKRADSYDDLYFIEGNIFDVQQQAIEYFKDRLPRVAYFYADKSGRYNDFMYPVDVLDEALSNALIHRDYSDISDEVTVFIYADRLEITNSGELPAKMVSGKSKVLPHGSVLRNPLMAEVFYVSGGMEKTGRGMMLISGTMHDAGRRLPEWISVNGKTTLRIYNTSAEKRLNERIERFLKEHRDLKTFTKGEYLSFFKGDISDRTAKNDLALLVETGRAVKENSGPKTSYKLMN